MLPAVQQREMREQRAVERRRRMEEERKARIFDAKNRIMGIDRDALSQQVEEKERAKLLEKERAQLYDEETNKTVKHLTMLETQYLRDKKAMEVAQQQFRENCQQKEARKEWDLSNPDHLKMDLPARTSDDDPRCGPASFQKFHGEDLNEPLRLKKQQEQMRAWCEQQAREKHERIAQAKDMETIHASRMLEVEAKKREMEDYENQTKLAMNAAVRDYNKALTEHTAAKSREMKVLEQQENLEEVNNNLASDFLSENPATCISCENPSRVKKYHYKGMTPEQIALIRQAQVAQTQDKKATKLCEKDDEEHWDLVTEAVRRNVLTGEREIQRRKKEVERATMHANKQLEAEKKLRYDYIYNTLYTNEPEEGYFQQFGTSSR